ncbi:ankyrin repeat domain-containing protein 26-like isoform X2 [Bos indicus]
MVEFLVKKKANIHAVDKMKRTALMLAVKYELPDVVRLLLQQGADIFSQDVFGWTAEEYAVFGGFNIFHQLISEYKEKRSKTSPENSNPVDESSEEHSSRRFPNKPGIDLGPTSNDEVLDFKTKHVLKPKLTKLMKASQQSKRNEAKCGILRPESTTFSQDNNSDSNVEDVVETFPKPSPWFEGICHPAFPSPEPVPKLLKSVTGLGRTKHSISESLPQKYVDHLPGTAGQRGKKTLNGQVEDSPGKYPNVKPAVRMKESVPNKTVRMKDLQTSSSDLSREGDWEMITEEEQEKLDEDENNRAQVEEEKKHKSSEVEVSENVCDAADESGSFQQRKRGGNSNQEFPAMQNEGSDSLRTSPSVSHEAGLVVMSSLSSDPGLHRKEVKKKNDDKWTPEEHVIAPIFEKTDSLTGGLLHVNDDGILREVDQGDDRPARKTPYEKKKVKEQINYVNDLDDLTQSSETVSEDGDGLYSTNSPLEVEPLDVGLKDSVGLLKIQDTVLSHERLVGSQRSQRSHCELLRGEFYRMKSKVRGLQKELSETKEVKSQLEHQKVEWERELGSLRVTLKQEEENRRNADMLCEKMMEHLRRKEDEYSKEVEVKQQLELTFQAVEVKLKTERNNLNQVSDSCEKAKDLLSKNHMLQEEIAMLRLERDALKNQHREKEENYFEDIEILKVKNDDLQKTIKLDEEMLTKTISHYTGQLNALTAENAMLNSKLENEKESKQRLETEVESYCSRLAAALHNRDQGQTSKRDLELAFRRARDEWLCLQDKMKSDVANLKDNNEMLSQQLSTVESKFNKLKIKLHHTTDDLREKTLMLKHVQRDLHQAEGQKQEIEHVYRNQQGKVNTYLGKQESLEERLFQLQSENMLLRQQLDNARNRADSREKTVISIQDQFQQIVRELQAEHEKQGLMLEERNKELVKECNHLKERMCQYENEKAEGEAVVRQLQQELDDAVKKQSMSEASLRLMSRYCPKLEAEAQDLENNCKLLQPRQVTSQTQAGFQQMEVRIKDLESELSKMKSLQEDSNKAELEKYKQLYLVECELIKSLEDKLDKTHQRLAVVSAKLQVEKQQNRSFFNTVSTRPVLEPPCVGNFNNPLVLNRNLTPRANLRFSTSIPRPSNNSMETYLTKMRRELDRSIARALREVDPQFASDAFRVSSQRSTDGSNVCDDLLL